jgi:glutamyl-tRNA synthetase
MDKPIRVRFAPSPTGYLHIGSVRTCLFNYLFCKQNNGTFILRVEDTDFARSEKQYELDLIEGLHWLGLDWQEGPTKGDDKLYYQSNRTEIYKKELQRMIADGSAYYCFCTKEELDGKKDFAESKGKPYVYDQKCLHLSKEEIEQNLKDNKPCVIRIKNPNKDVIFKDLILGEIKFDTTLFGDFVIATAIDKPLYNIAAVIDDNDMAISHVIRGEDHVSNTPKQIIMYEALGYKNIPEFAHIPLILGTDRTKLSKRHNVQAIREYREQGYLADSLINFIAFLGWNPGTDQEIFSLDELVKSFSLDRCQKAGAIFNVAKLDWYNGMYIRSKKIEELTDFCLPYLIKSELIKFDGTNYTIVATGESIDIKYIQDTVSIYQERLTKLLEISELVNYFYQDKLTYDKNILLFKDMSVDDLKVSLDKLIDIYSNIDEKDYNRVRIQEILEEQFQANIDTLKKRGNLLWPLRVALSGKSASAGPFEISEILGKQKTLKRILDAKHLYE